MGLNIPDGIEAKCDHEGCPIVAKIPIRYIKSGFTKTTLFNKLRKMGWYVSTKRDEIICPDCADSMGIKRKKPVQEEEKEETFVHKDCGGIIDFDSMGNYKCLKCGFVSKDDQFIEVFEGDLDG